MKILVVDDDPLICIALSTKLRVKGYEVLVASNSLQALEIIEKNELQLIICDIIMPGISGLELLILLKHFYFNPTPLIVISSLNDPRLAVLPNPYGINRFISKPIQFDELYKEVRCALNQVL